ncbi:MAG: methionyl-tRNA formyltransferase [Candidatus Kapabacteria bacterium]|nr:methionyl-tRNA formyltransferase [Candidatus Kapabacteria bacterium]
MPNIVFMGTPAFAVPALQALHHALGVRAVVTVPDKAKGRGLTLQPPDVKTAALELGIATILQPTSLKDPAFQAELAALQPDVLCVIAFRILPRSVYAMARLGAFNVHASLLPKYRGAAPINHAIIHGETETGVTSFLLNDVVDTGKIIAQKRIAIPDGMTAGELYAALMPLAADCAVETCRALLDGTATPMPQHDDLATPAPKVFRETSVVDWMHNRNVVRNFIHGLSPTPAAWTTWNGEPLKIYRASYSDMPCPAGQWTITNGCLIAGCLDGSLMLDEIQLPGKRRMMSADVVRGYRGSLEGTFQ